MKSKLELAHDICLYAHKGQVDKAGKPYHFHPEWVADHVEGENEKIAALLHDVMEDTEFPPSVLEALFGDEVMAALRLLTHDKSTPYLEYVAALKSNPIARAVKIADLTHNSDTARLAGVMMPNRVRLEKYKKALAILK